MIKNKNQLYLILHRQHKQSLLKKKKDKKAIRIDLKIQPKKILKIYIQRNEIIFL